MNISDLAKESPYLQVGEDVKCEERISTIDVYDYRLIVLIQENKNLKEVWRCPAI